MCFESFSSIQFNFKKASLNQNGQSLISSWLPISKMVDFWKKYIAITTFDILVQTVIFMQISKVIDFFDKYKLFQDGYLNPRWLTSEKIIQ